MNKEKDLALISPKDLSLVDSSLNAQQLKLILKKTPSQYVHERPAKGGGKWEYVTGGYVKKCLNLMFGFDWDFEIVEQQVLFGEAIVKGRLTCRTNGKTISKMQFGNKDIIYKKEPVNGERQPLSIGNDLKAAATDCLKKCAAEIGIAADIYNKMDFKEVMVDISEPVTLQSVSTLFAQCEVLNLLSEQDLIDGKRILTNKEEASYQKLHNKYTTLLNN